MVAVVVGGKGEGGDTLAEVLHADRRGRGEEEEEGGEEGPHSEDDQDDPRAEGPGAGRRPSDDGRRVPRARPEGGAAIPPPRPAAPPA